MSLLEIEAELDKLTPGELRELALKSWRAFVLRESQQWVEEDQDVLAALDEAVTRAEATKDLGLTGNEVRARLREWTSR